MNRKSKILLIDDEPDMLSGCSKIISALGSLPVAVSNPNQAAELLEKEEFDLIFSDLLMPDIDGMEMLSICQRLAPATPVIIFSAFGTIDRAVAAMKAGAFDFIEKPFDAENLKILIEKGLRQRGLYIERNNLLRQLKDKFSFDNIIGNCSAMLNIFEMINSVAETDVNVLITGESGTGKELIARSIHARSRRKTKAFVPVNCGAFPDSLFEAELFGYEKGAFTGAEARKKGLLEFADKGTFFLDEVCEMPVSLQIKLLRTLQDRNLRRVGGNELIHVDIRIISATNRNIESALESESLRKDFYYRLNVVNIQVPPLRDRRDDIRLLADHFLNKCLQRSTKKVSGFGEEVLNFFERYEWPGNVREMENTIERALTLTRNDFITVNDLPPDMIRRVSENNDGEGNTLVAVKQKALEKIERKYLTDLLSKHKGNVTRVASEAGLTRRHIHRLIKQYNLNPSEWRT